MKQFIVGLCLGLSLGVIGVSGAQNFFHDRSDPLETDRFRDDVRRELDDLRSQQEWDRIERELNRTFDQMYSPC